ncbi:hypothetical protein [Streptomyces sp. SAS_260]|uniref:hypothetical protein n=1 Tax=Streptomyces sp. SAS_260 TaxID=3412751 RepID=UPI00403CF8AA
MVTTSPAEPRSYAVFLSDQAPLDALPEDGGGPLQFVLPADDGIRLMNRHTALSTVSQPPHDDGQAPGLVQALRLRTRTAATAMFDDPTAAALVQPELVDAFASKVLAVPTSARWREAISTAVISPTWCAGLLSTGHLPATALGTLKAEARTLHRQLVPLWRRRTRHGRILSLDAALGNGLSLHDLVAADTDLLTHTTAGVFDDQRLNSVLRHLNPPEQQVLFTYAAQEGTTWAEAAATTGADHPEALGDRVRHKTKRLATEHQRRTRQRKMP